MNVVRLDVTVGVPVARVPDSLILRRGLRSLALLVSVRFNGGACVSYLMRFATRQLSRVMLAGTDGNGVKVAFVDHRLSKMRVLSWWPRTPSRTNCTKAS